jgi:hypothetical protein
MDAKGTVGAAIFVVFGGALIVDFSEPLGFIVVKSSFVRGGPETPIAIYTCQ